MAKPSDKKIPNAAAGEKVPPKTEEKESFVEKVSHTISDLAHKASDALSHDSKTESKPEQKKETAPKKSGAPDPGSQDIKDHAKFSKFKKGSSDK